LTLTRPDGPVVIQLPPNSYTLTASYRDGDLTPVQKPVTVEKGKTKQLHFRFVYGKVALTSDPPGAEVRELPKGMWVSLDKLSILRVGTHQLEARLAGLEDVPEEVVVADGKVRPHNFQFKYGKMMITSVPPGAEVWENETRLGSTPYSNNVRFGQVSYRLVSGNEKPRTRSATISSLTNYYLLSVDFTQPDTWQSSIGMQFAHIPKTADNPDGEYWVGVYEVTQEEYAQVMGTNSNPSKVKGTRLPVQNVSWKDAMDFCDRLLMRETNSPPAGMTHYTLPTETQWEHFLGDAKWRDAVIKRQKPEEVGSTQKPNSFGLHDVLGNVWEMCVGDVHHLPRVVRGGGFDTHIDEGLAPRKLRDELAADPFTGFRIVLVPEPK